MSSEGKKKRGESGVANAKTQPFRLGGSGCDFSTAPRRPYHPTHASSTIARGALGGLLAAQLGYDFRLTQLMSDHIDCSFEKAPTVAAQLDLIELVQRPELCAA